MNKKIYQIKVNLRGSKPNIWRRILIPSEMLMSDFHYVIQATMGWTNSHLHQFIHDGEYYAKRIPEEFMVDDFGIDYENMKVSDFLTREKDKMIYEYDFGDGWVHDIVLEKITDPDPEQFYPVCIKGKMNCPPEDCGGVWGYADMLEILKDPAHEEYENFSEWLREDFDPGYFNRNEINAKLRNPNYGFSGIF